MTAYQFSQPWISKLKTPKNDEAMEWAHLRTYLQGIDDGTTSLFNLTALNASIGNLTVTGSTTGLAYLPLIGGTMSGNIAFSPTTKGIVGTTTNDAATTGNIGEYIESIVTNISVGTSTQISDATSISCGAGDWSICVEGTYTPNGATITSNSIGVSTTAGNSGTGLASGDTIIDLPPATTALNPGGGIVPKRFSFASTTTVYLKISSTYAVATPKFYGRISALRPR